MLRGSVPSTNSNALGHFSRSPQANIPRSKFNRSHGLKTTFDEGELVPIFVDEMLPGDTFKLNLHAFARMSTPIFPIMDNMYLETFFFAVPNRILWDNWEKFNGYNPEAGIQTTDYVVPFVNSPIITGWEELSLADYFGIPTKVTSLKSSALPFRAYNKVINDWFRDQNLQDEVPLNTDDGPDPVADYSVRRRNKRYDYFTSCLPWPQKSVDQLIPIASDPRAPIQGMGFQTGQPVGGAADTVDFDLGLVTYPNNMNTGNLSYPLYVRSDAAGNADVFADLSEAGGTINELREAFQMQKLYERDARGGTRYTEIIKAHFGVNSPDMRLQRSEYIGGGSTPIIVNPVAQTTQAAAPTNKDGLGVLGGYGVSVVNGHGFTYSATEHMVIIGIVSVRADLNYQQGLERMWSRETRFDFYWPVLSHLGEQAVLNKEIYAQGNATDDDVFGYQERYAEYRYKPSQITGAFRSNAVASYDVWHLAQDFGALPTLNEDFIQEEAPMERIEAVPSTPDFIFDGFFSYMCARPMPVYAVPGLVDHF